MLNWASRFGIFLFLDSNAHTLQGGAYECLAGVGALERCGAGAGDLLEELHALRQIRQEWLFGHISYELKDRLEPSLHSDHPIRHEFPLLTFFVPEIVAYVRTGSAELVIETAAADPDAVFREILDMPDICPGLPRHSFLPRTGRDTYLAHIAAIREHIRNGDCYELNYCTEAYTTAAIEDPVSIFHRLNALSPAPFAACYRLEDQYLLCASPERYLRRTGNDLISQPIKGTARRSPDPAADAVLKEALRRSEKERAENVMIVDLVRNDLARSCSPGSIAVQELFGIYTFPQVHQMISTVRGTLRPDIPWTDALRHSFPMGSMTGAPKVKVMELIERYEEARRGLFSGTVGYIAPSGDFDFNVVIRSLFYNAASHYLSYQTGGAITWDSDPEAEWAEMRLKAAALERIFSGEQDLP